MMNLMKNETRRDWQKSIRDRIQTWNRWLRPGLGVKRWVGIILLGATFLAIGFALFILDIYRKSPDVWWLPLISFASLKSLPRLVRVLVFGVVGLGTLLWGIIGLNRSLLTPYLRPGYSIVDTLEKHRLRKTGPKIVAIGGGNGLATLLRGLKEYSHNIYAVVTVADDGGSSGRLRETMGVLPPGDIRNCLAALSDNEDLLTQLFQYRFANGGSGLDGHSFGNLFLSSLAEITGSFEEAIAESGRVLAVSGRVYPATLENVRLGADIKSADSKRVIRVEGESKIPKTPGEIQRVWLMPDSPSAFPRSIRAILSADLIVIGPGSLYTSILPNLLVKDISAAIRASQALKIYVCNVATQAGETENFSCGDHAQVIDDHVGSDLFDIVLANNATLAVSKKNFQWVKADAELSTQYLIHLADLIDEEHPWRHSSQKLAQTLIALLQERTGPLTL